MKLISFIIFLTLIGCTPLFKKPLPMPKYKEKVTLVDDFYGPCWGYVTRCETTPDCYLCEVSIMECENNDYMGYLVLKYHRHDDLECPHPGSKVFNRSNHQ